ncbi:(2E,6E)-farnesyl diphosphate synthase [Marinomonas mediterranea]|uniref:Geranyltranstransferase n=1 Tax=Marinomonas mediterranea (strain ATCC 700492 / JCM 21426 / NBRC 103028 / MMB-1) TaxID=717774 RepID=F2K4H8_MARM1|nr:farnesyl diphosphate synthase [Marinomonas mediterranea]ADZ90277.1 Geranyltranstransferase [Marinomonas mediterranea MMB-1]WCN16467.1 (2E,6E)-farnesyl diphosphate synthase [Marinomonas mediterranea MMB-1]
MNLEQFSHYSRDRVDRYLNDQLTQYDAADYLHEAMRYSLFNGGKRVRPMLVYATAELFSESNRLTDASAAAIESIHAYSLIHDDLPAMDDDDLRRGKPTCHIQFDEATAILTGDALQTFAFELLSASYNEIDTDNLADCKTRQLRLIRSLSRASGRFGMVTGQMIDLNNVDRSITLETLEKMHQHKTGALIRASVLMGAQSVGIEDQKILSQLDKYASAIGLAFQVQDDIIDITSDTQTLGKNQFSDSEANKPTYPKLLGLEGAREKANTLKQEAIEAISPFGDKAAPLIQLASYIISRNH